MDELVSSHCETWCGVSCEMACAGGCVVSGMLTAGGTSLAESGGWFVNWL